MIRRSVQPAFFMARQKLAAGKREVFRQPKRGSEELKKQVKQDIAKKKETKDKKFYEELAPKFVSAMLFGCIIP